MVPLLFGLVLYTKLVDIMSPLICVVSISFMSCILLQLFILKNTYFYFLILSFGFFYYFPDYPINCWIFYWYPSSFYFLRFLYKFSILCFINYFCKCVGYSVFLLSSLHFLLFHTCLAISSCWLFIFIFLFISKWLSLLTFILAILGSLPVVNLIRIMIDF